MTTLTWLHLADLHYSSNSNYDIDKVLEALWIDLDCLADDGLKPDLIFFTGDIAKSGKSDEYKMAKQVFFEKILEETDLPPTRLFIVPGNHDVEWSKMDRVATAGLKELLHDPKIINDFLSPKRNRKVFFSQFASYADFINNHNPKHPKFNSQKFFYSELVEVNGVAIGVLGLNSSWMSAVNYDANKQVLDQGHLLVGERQLDMALEHTSEADLRISLMHHPLDWLHSSERSRIKRRLSSECNFILHGHLHEPEVEIRRALSGTSVFIPTGALYHSREYPNGYNMVEYNHHTRHVTIHFRRYVDLGKNGSPDWISDLALTGDKGAGKFEFDLLDIESESRPKSALVPNVDNSKDAKRILFVEDDEGWKKLMLSILFPPDFDLQFASSAAEARHILNNDFDLLIVNLCLSGDRDYEGEILLNSLSQQSDSSNLNCIVLTGHMCPTKGLYDRYHVCEVFVKGDLDHFDKNRFLQSVRKAVGLL
jgi:predicted MPP superfamily phosphohydrolase